MLKKLFQKLNKEKVRTEDEYDLKLSTELKETVASVNNIVGESDDVVQRDFFIGDRSATLFYIIGLCDKDSIEVHVLRPLIRMTEQETKEIASADIIEYLRKDVITLGSSSAHESFDEAIPKLMEGNAMLIIDGTDKLIILDVKSRKERSVEEPQSEVLIRGPRDGLIEDIQTNITLIRKRIRDPNLTIQIGELGRRSKKKFALIYLKGVANDDIIDEFRYRVSCIDIDDVAETGVIEQLIEDDVFSPFPQMVHTERPDRCASGIMNGYIILLLDGTPFALKGPASIHQLLKSPEDYYERWLIGSLVRFLRYVAAFIAVFLPALYIAMVSFHQGMIPTILTLSLAGSREGVPFPAYIEAFIMEITFELLREAGNRLPRPIGQTIGVVGGLVIGDAAVRAGIVSPVMVIVVAITAIASFAMPTYSVGISFRIIRFIMMAAAAAFGLFGIMIVYICINIHLVGLRSFGSYYLSPFAPYRFRDWLDLVIRAPMSLQRTRTDFLRADDNVRQRVGDKPK
jgi:spore germination protein